jgi:hypothetical protein
MRDYSYHPYPKRKRTRRYPKSGDSIRALRAKLDTIFSLYIRTRDQSCFANSSDCSGPIQAGHLITRGATRIRWDERNCFGSCRSHNFRHEYRPEIMTAWFIAKYGNELYNDLVQLSRTTWKPTRPELIRLIAIYEGRIKDAITSPD